MQLIDAELRLVPPPTPPAGDFFGQSVSLSGDTAFVGAFLGDDAGASSGAAFVFAIPLADANDLIAKAQAIIALLG